MIVIVTNGFYLLLVKDYKYIIIKKTRKFAIREELSTHFKQLAVGNVLLIGIEHEGAVLIVAEYEIDKCSIGVDSITLDLEPIYNAPIQNGIRFNEMVYAKFESYELNQWAEMLKEKIVKISEKDYLKLAKLLVV